MLKAAKITLFLILAVYVGVNLLVFTNQRQLMFLPSIERIDPNRVGLVDVDQVALRTSSGTELISWFGRPAAGRPTVLFFHGNAGAVHHRAHRFRELMAEGYGVFVLGYPGYGGNAGEPSEASLKEASHLAYDHLRSLGIDPGDIVIYGESIGSGVAVQLAANVDARGLVLEAPMSSATDVAREHYPYLMAGLFLKDKFRSVDYIERIGMPLLIMHGDRDAVIPLRLGRKLVDRALAPKTMIVLKGAGHNNLNQFSTNEIVREFIETL